MVRPLLLVAFIYYSAAAFESHVHLCTYVTLHFPPKTQQSHYFFLNNSIWVFFLPPSLMLLSFSSAALQRGVLRCRLQPSHAFPSCSVNAGQNHWAGRVSEGCPNTACKNTKRSLEGIPCRKIAALFSLFCSFTTSYPGAPCWFRYTVLVPCHHMANAVINIAC